MAPATQKKAYEAAKAYLQSKASVLGIAQLLDRQQLTKLYRNPFNDNRTPDFIAVTRQGLIYTSGTKLAEHGGFAANDRNVALLVSNPSLAALTNTSAVETRQIAPTILRALGLSPSKLDAVRIEHTQMLPGLMD